MAAIAIISIAPLIVSAVAKNLLVSNLTTVADDALSIMLRLRTSTNQTVTTSKTDYSYTVPELKQLESDDMYEQIAIARSMLLDVKNLLIVNASHSASSSNSTAAPVSPEKIVHEICDYLAYPDEECSQLMTTTNTNSERSLDWRVDYSSSSLFPQHIPICRTLLLTLTNIQSSLHTFYQTLFTIQHKRDIHQQKWFSTYRSLDIQPELNKLTVCRTRIQNRLDTFFKILKFQQWYQQLANHNRTPPHHTPYC